ncbi:MAG: metallophosphoesterase [Novosphingobium sp.]
MLIGQVTDIHIGFEPGNPDEPNMHRLNAVLERLFDGPNRLDLLLLTGDLTENGDADSFRRLAGALESAPCPVWPIPGNHDERTAFAETFSYVPMTGAFAQYALNAGRLRLLMLDTLDPGRHGGAFCEARAAWLRGELAAFPDRPTVIVMHHPPFVSGIDWMDPDPGEEWIMRFAEATREHGQIEAILCGHLHRSVVTRWNGAPLIVCPSSAPSVALDLSPIDPTRPDNRALIRDAPPGYALHRWDGRNLVSHFERVGGFEAVARFDKGLQGMIRGMLAERR